MVIRSMYSNMEGVMSTKLLFKKNKLNNYSSESKTNPDNWKGRF